MDDEFALFAAEISKLDEEAPPSTSGAAAGSGDAPPKIEAPPPPAPTVNSRPKVIAKAPEHVPAGPAARPSEAARYLPIPPRRTGTTNPGAAATGTHLQRGWAGGGGAPPVGVPASPPGVNGVAHGDLGSIPPPPPQPVKKIGKPVFRSGRGQVGGQEPGGLARRTITGSCRRPRRGVHRRDLGARVREVPELPEGAGGKGSAQRQG